MDLTAYYGPMKNERGFWLGCGLLMCLFLAGSGRWLETTGASALQDARTTQQATSSSSNPPAFSAKGGDEEPETVGDIPGLVSAIIGRISATECSNKKCTIAIPNYELPDGSITVYGLRVADAITRELVKQGYKAGGLELSALRSYIKDESPSAEPRNRENTCQMARKLKL